jgi:hypothetical protein
MVSVARYDNSFVYELPQNRIKVYCACAASPPSVKCLWGEVIKDRVGMEIARRLEIRF